LAVGKTLAKKPTSRRVDRGYQRRSCGASMAPLAMWPVAKFTAYMSRDKYLSRSTENVAVKKEFK